MSTSLVWWNEKLGKTQPRSLVFDFSVTAGTVAALVPGGPVLFTTTALASQSVIDTFLGTTNEFLLAAFDTTPMGVDSVGVIVNLTGGTPSGSNATGQCATLVSCEAQLYSGANLATLSGTGAIPVSTLTTTLSTSAAKGAYGNVAARFIVTGLDAATGLLRVSFNFISK